MEMILSGVSISAKDAKEWHIATSVHSKEKLVDETQLLANKIAAYSQITASVAKRAVNKSMESGLQGGI